MKSRISFFNKGIFKNLVRRFWPLWTVYFIGWFLTLVLPTLTEATVPGDFVPNYLESSITSLFRGGLVANFILAILVATAMFGFLHNSRSTGLIASMPVRREAVFGSAYLAGLLPIVTVNLLIAALNVLFSLEAHVPIGVLLKVNAAWFALNSLGFLIFYGIAVFVGMMTSNSVAMPVLYFIFNFFFSAMEQVVRQILSLFVFGFTDSYGSTLDFLSPPVFLYGKVQMNFEAGSLLRPEQVSISGLDYVYIYLAVSLVLSVIALLLFRKHRMETSGDVIAIPCLRPIFKYGVSVCASLCFGLLFYDILTATVIESSAFIFIIGLLIGAFIGYFASEMLLNKSIHVFRGKWTGYIVLACLCAVFGFCCILDVFGIAGKLPEASEVDYMCCDVTGNAIYDEDSIEKLISLNHKIVAEKGRYAIVSAVDETTRYVEFTYSLKNGDYISRQYNITDDDNYRGYCDIINNPNIILESYTPTVSMTEEHVETAFFYLTVETMAYDEFGHELGYDYGEDILNPVLTPEQAVDYYFNALLPDIKNGNIKLIEPQPVYTSRNVFMQMTIELLEIASVNGAPMERRDNVVVELSPDCVYSIQWIQDNLGIDPMKYYNE